jgi:uncharacterized protein with HEPN domain
MKRETTKRLHDVSAACGEVMAYCVETSRDAFLADRTLQLVVAHLTLIIGEAMGRAERSEPSLVNVIPDLRDIVDTRNRVIHGYDDVNYLLLWDIVQEKVPPLKIIVDALLTDNPVENPKDV